MKIKIGLAVSFFSLILALLIALIYHFIHPVPGSWIIFTAWTFFILEAILLWGVFDHKSPLFGKVFYRGPRALPAICLTFDDGPTEPYTSALLAILKENEVPATFFVLGKKVELYPEAIKKIAAEGHEIGNHGYSHEVLPLRGPADIREEIAKTGKLVFSLTGQKLRLFRAPHGWKGPFLASTVSKAGYKLVSWTSGVWDTDRPGKEKIIERSLKALKNGAVLLFHDGRGLEEMPDCTQLLEALPVIIQAAKDSGLSFMTASGMLAAVAAARYRR